MSPVFDSVDEVVVVVIAAAVSSSNPHHPPATTSSRLLLLFLRGDLSPQRRRRQNSKNRQSHRRFEGSLFLHNHVDRHPYLAQTSRPASEQASQSVGVDVVARGCLKRYRSIYPRFFSVRQSEPNRTAEPPLPPSPCLAVSLCEGMRRALFCGAIQPRWHDGR